MMCKRIPLPRKQITIRQVSKEEVGLPNGNHGNMEKVKLMTDSPRVARVISSSQSELAVAIQGQIRQIQMTLSGISERQRCRNEREDEEAEIDLEWKHLAAVLDRLFFWIYLISITISIVLLFPAM